MSLEIERLPTMWRKEAEKRRQGAAKGDLIESAVYYAAAMILESVATELEAAIAKATGAT